MLAGITLARIGKSSTDASGCQHSSALVPSAGATVSTTLPDNDTVHCGSHHSRRTLASGRSLLKDTQTS
nr:hypothetical protein CFP56_30168 [Quercus suber]